MPVHFIDTNDEHSENMSWWGELLIKFKELLQIAHKEYSMALFQKLLGSKNYLSHWCDPTVAGKTSNTHLL